MHGLHRLKVRTLAYFERPIYAYSGKMTTFNVAYSRTNGYNMTLHPRESLIIFDEIQQYPKARQSIKRLEKDGRFDYIETGSLVSIRENVQDITIPSEERKMQVYPMDFEEFCIALNEESMISYIKQCFLDSIWW